jgi:N6-adenosine-specific RNA methylase IME4
MKYDIILADPPWRYSFSKTKNRAIENHYPTMSMSELLMLPVQGVSHDASILFLWATSPKLREALGLIEEWGFTYVSHAMWDKEIIGMGYWFRGQHELLLVGRKKNSKCTPVAHRVASVFRDRRSSKHSKKPAVVYEWIERAWPDSTKLELFARNGRPGWNTAGNEIDGLDIEEALIRLGDDDN